MSVAGNEARGDGPAPGDERGHRSDGSLDWTESWHFDFRDHTAGFAGYARITLVPDRRRVWYWSALHREAENLVAVIENEIALPRTAGSLEARGDGLWFDHNCETPLEHWSIGNEAFALGVDRPAELLGKAYGELVPLGLDLEWESEHRPAWEAVGRGYAVSCRVSGEVLVGSEVIDTDVHGSRHHRWGPRSEAPAALRFVGHTDRGVALRHEVALDDPGPWVSWAAESLESDAETLPGTTGDSLPPRPNSGPPWSQHFEVEVWTPALADWTTGQEPVYLAVARLGDAVGWLELSA